LAAFLPSVSCWSIASRSIAQHQDDKAGASLLVQRRPANSLTH
jgi:hypothetical protein